jgi:hypothetical protein
VTLLTTVGEAFSKTSVGPATLDGALRIVYHFSESHKVTRTRYRLMHLLDLAKRGFRKKGDALPKVSGSPTQHEPARAASKPLVATQNLESPVASGSARTTSGHHINALREAKDTVPELMKKLSQEKDYTQMANEVLRYENPLALVRRWIERSLNQVRAERQHVGPLLCAIVDAAGQDMADQLRRTVGAVLERFVDEQLEEESATWKFAAQVVFSERRATVLDATVLNDMLAYLLLRAGDGTAKGANISTIHSFIHDVLKEYHAIPVEQLPLPSCTTNFARFRPLNVLHDFNNKTSREGGFELRAVSSAPLRQIADPEILTFVQLCTAKTGETQECCDRLFEQCRVSPRLRDPSTPAKVFSGVVHAEMVLNYVSVLESAIPLLNLVVDVEPRSVREQGILAELYFALRGSFVGSASVRESDPKASGGYRYTSRLRASDVITDESRLNVYRYFSQYDADIEFVLGPVMRMTATQSIAPKGK